jgi:hypothetical protein
MEALEGVLDLLSLFFVGGVSIVKNRIATGFRIGRIIVIEVSDSDSDSDSDRLRPNGPTVHSLCV